jgi:AraC-like DNA-binding protein
MHSANLISFGHFRIADLALHRNRGMELTYISRGRMEWVVDGQIEVVKQGDIFFTLPWQVHGSPVLQQPENHAYHLLFRLSGEMKIPQRSFRFPAELEFAKPESETLSRAYCQTRRHAWSAGPRIRSAFPWMIEAFESNNPLEQAKGWSLLRVVLIELQKLMRVHQEAPLTLLESERRVATFLEQLRESCGEEWSLTAMASACGIQRTRFANLVLKQTAFSPMAYLMRLRVDKARILLRRIDLSITDIAMQCGFSSSQYFANVFRKCMGLSPTEYREHYPQLYQLKQNPEKIPWRTIEEERERVRTFKGLNPVG